MNIEEIEANALNLLNARFSSKPISSLKKSLDLNEAQEILKKGIDLRLSRGEDITGVVLQNENYFSFLTNQMNLIPGSNFSLKDCISPKVTAHFVYYVDSALKGNATLEQIINAISSIGLALLITDSRFEKGGEVSFPEKIADNFFSTYYFLGKKRLDFKEMKDRCVRVALCLNHIKKFEVEVSDLISALSKEKSLNIGPSTIVLTPNLFEAFPLSLNMDISLVADYFGATSFKVI